MKDRWGKWKCEALLRRLLQWFRLETVGGGGVGQCQWNEEKLENVLSLRCLRNTQVEICLVNSLEFR